MKNIWTIMKKEFVRFFKDKRLLLTLILPGVLIYVIYSFLGQGIFQNIGQVDDGYVYEVYTVDMPEEFSAPFTGLESIRLTPVTEEEAQAKKSEIENQETDLLVVFPKDFKEKYEAAIAGSAALPTVETYFNAVRDESSAAYDLFTGVLSGAGLQSRNYFSFMPCNLATEKDFTGMIFSMIALMLLLMFLFSGCMAVAPESIAGEKERGSFATMLVTPVKRSHIAVGKILSLSVISLLSGLCSFLGLILSLPKLMGGMEGVSASVYRFGDYMMILGIVLSSVLVIVALISVISAFAKSVKEATGMIGPLMILVMLLGVSTMFSNGAVGSYFWYLIPLYNSARAMSGIFSFAASGVAVLITVIANLLCAVLLALLLAKMFDSEKVMFNK